MSDEKQTPISILDDVSTLTCVSEKVLRILVNRGIYCICEAVKEDIISNKEITEVDIGIGILYIKHVGDEIQYKLIPSYTFEKAVRDTVTNKLNLLKDATTKSLATRFEKLYKDLC